MDYTLESFMNYCDDMMIANEGFREGVSIIDKIINTLQRGLEWFKRAIYKLKEKMAKGKYIAIPKNVHEGLVFLEETIIDFHKGCTKGGYYMNLSDNKISEVKEQVNKSLEAAEKHRHDDAEMSAIPLSEIYQNLQIGSKNISNVIRHAEAIKPKLKNATDDPDEHIHRLSNEVDLMHLLMKIDRYYLSFPVITSKDVNPVEDPDSQIVTQKERDDILNKNKKELDHKY